ncbi:MAG TPA: hypothetical protein VM097_07860 [Mycobacteriales bacterium]|nr:hypothetical protein [Mycobacteriales bacterium]
MKLAAATVTLILGSVVGLTLGWLVWVAASPHVSCVSDLVNESHCPTPPPFLPFAFSGIGAGMLIVAVILLLVRRSLDR